MPHVVYRHQRMPFHDTFATVVSVVLSREDRCLPITSTADSLRAVVAELAGKGRAANRRLAAPWRWF